MKRNIYIFLFVVLGVILQFLAHALIEMWYIGLLLANFPIYGFGLTWETWVLIHNVLTVAFLLAGAWIGHKEGIYWWRKIYEENLIAGWKKKVIPVKWLIIVFVLLFVGSAYWYYVDDIKPYLNKNIGPVIEDQDFIRQQVIWQREREQEEALRSVSAQEIPEKLVCNTDNDCVLWLCAGALNKQWAKSAPPDLPCMMYQGYTAQCIEQKCTAVK